MEQPTEEEPQACEPRSAHLPKISSFKFIRREGLGARGSVYSHVNLKLARPPDKADSDNLSTQATFAPRFSRLQTEKPAAASERRRESQEALDSPELGRTAKQNLHNLHSESRLHTTGHLEPLEGDSGQVSSEHPPASRQPLHQQSSTPKSLLVGDSRGSRFGESVADNDALEEELLGYNTAQQNRHWAHQAQTPGESRFRGDSSRTDSMRNKVSIQLSADSNRRSLSRLSQQSQKKRAPQSKATGQESLCKLDSLEEQVNEGSSSSFITEHGWSK